MLATENVFVTLFLLRGDRVMTIPTLDADDIFGRLEHTHT